MLKTKPLVKHFNYVFFLIPPSCRANAPAVPINLHRLQQPTWKKEKVFVFSLHAQLVRWRLNFGSGSSMNRFQDNVNRSIPGSMLIVFILPAIVASILWYIWMLYIPLHYVHYQIIRIILLFNWFLLQTLNCSLVSQILWEKKKIVPILFYLLTVKFPTVNSVPSLVSTFLYSTVLNSSGR